MMLLLVLAALVAVTAPRPVATIASGSGPCGAAAGFGSVWVAVYGTGELLRIDARTNRVIRRIRVVRGICPVAVAHGAVWVASDQANVLYRVDPAQGRVAGRTRVPRWPAHVRAAFGSVWVSAYERGTVARLDPRTGRVVRTYAVGGHPSGLARANGSLWIAFGRDGTSLGRLNIVSGELTRIALGHKAPGFLAAIGGALWTTTADGFAVRVDPATGSVVASIPVPGTPADVARAPDGTLWVAEKEHSTLTRIDAGANRVLDVTPAGPGALSIASARGAMWVTSFAGSDVRRYAP
jgi:streptogramin lyase